MLSLGLFNRSINNCYRQLHSNSLMMNSKVAVVLAGCGVYDGSEIHEASACLVHLSREGASVEMFAPNINQLHVIDHTKGKEDEVSRNVLVESARIARGNINSLDKLNADKFDALIIPGGFGAAKNLSNWAIEGTNCTVNKEVENAINMFQKSNKPMGFACIAPVLAAKCIPGVEITVGKSSGENWPYAGTCDAVSKCGAVHIEKDVTDVHVDTKHKVVTTPAYMCEAKVHLIYDGVGKMVKNVLELVKK